MNKRKEVGVPAQPQARVQVQALVRKTIRVRVRQLVRLKAKYLRRVRARRSHESRSPIAPLLRKTSVIRMPNLCWTHLKPIKTRLRLRRQLLLLSPNSMPVLSPLGTPQIQTWPPARLNSPPRRRRPSSTTPCSTSLPNSLSSRLNTTKVVCTTTRDLPSKPRSSTTRITSRRGCTRQQVCTARATRARTTRHRSRTSRSSF